MSSPAQRKRAYRSRQRDGRIILRVEAKGYELTTALIESGFVSEAEALDRRKIECAAAVVLDRWARRWHNSR
jgi:hypothetical protein